MKVSEEMMAVAEEITTGNTVLVVEGFATLLPVGFHQRNRPRFRWESITLAKLVWLAEQWVLSLPDC